MVWTRIWRVCLAFCFFWGLHTFWWGWCHWIQSRSGNWHCSWSSEVGGRSQPCRGWSENENHRFNTSKLPRIRIASTYTQPFLHITYLSIPVDNLTHCWYYLRRMANKEDEDNGQGHTSHPHLTLSQTFMAGPAHWDEALRNEKFIQLWSISPDMRVTSRSFLWMMQLSSNRMLKGMMLTKIRCNQST